MICWIIRGWNGCRCLSSGSTSSRSRRRASTGNACSH